MLFEESEFPGTFNDNPHKLLCSAVLGTDPQAHSFDSVICRWFTWAAAWHTRAALWGSVSRFLKACIDNTCWLVAGFVEGNVRVPPLRFCNRVASVPPLQSHPEAALLCTSLFTIIILFPTYWPYVILDKRWLYKAFTIQTTDIGGETERGPQVL